ncbi:MULTISPECIES: hypothetical protein [unclassified Moorena]|uniref:hypothetical protein n=2 Tax=Moorena TaxID=1155738 RepID=UPI0013FF0FF2|nr:MULTISPECIES: hypothetical protein [unclassified Moorena]NEO17268.1 hypothetical protein [Moorena sp. SIO3E8]NEQ03822.1 hypothetical protein [Moorena sp. SIO3F7]
MTSSFDTEIGIALSTSSWNVGDFRLFESTQPDVILYMPNRSFLVVNSDNKQYQATLTVFRKWDQGIDSVKGGALSFTATLMPQYDFLTQEALKQEWGREILKSGYFLGENLQFLPLPIRNIQVQILLDPSLGKVTIPEVEATSSVSAGETTSLLLDLTAKGAQKWVENIQSGTQLTGGLIFTYEYPQVLPQVQAQIHVKGKSIFANLSSVLKLKEDGYYYGTREEVDRAWEQLVQDQLIEIKLPEPLPPELTGMEENLLKTFAEQVQHDLFNRLFEPISNTETATIGTADHPESPTSGVMYKLTWREEMDAVELSFELSVDGGWTWLKGSVSKDFTTLFGEIDSSYINTIYQEQSFPVSITVQGDPLLSTVALSWSTDDGKVPEALVFGSEGGKLEYTLISRNPDKVTIPYQAKVGFKLAKWPVIEVEGAATVAEGGNQILLEPGKWICNLMIHLQIREGDQTKPPAELPRGDYLVVNISYTGPHLSTRIRESARISPLAPMRFTYLQDPKGRSSQLYLSANGVLELICKENLKETQ